MCFTSIYATRPILFLFVFFYSLIKDWIAQIKVLNVWHIRQQILKKKKIYIYKRNEGFCRIEGRGVMLKVGCQIILLGKQIIHLRKRTLQSSNIQKQPEWHELWIGLYNFIDFSKDRYTESVLLLKIVCLQKYPGNFDCLTFLNNSRKENILNRFKLLKMLENWKWSHKKKILYHLFYLFSEIWSNFLKKWSKKRGHFIDIRSNFLDVAVIVF